MGGWSARANCNAQHLVVTLETAIYLLDSSILLAIERVSRAGRSLEPASASVQMKAFGRLWGHLLKQEAIYPSKKSRTTARRTDPLAGMDIVSAWMTDRGFLDISDT